MAVSVFLNVYQQLNKLSTWLHPKPPSNITTALEKAAMKYDGGDGQIAFANFRRIHKEFPFLLHPAYRLQEKFETVVMGKRWWLKKKKELGLIPEDPREPSRFGFSLGAFLPSLSAYRRTRPAVETTVACFSVGEGVTHVFFTVYSKTKQTKYTRVIDMLACSSHDSVPSSC